MPLTHPAHIRGDFNSFFFCFLKISSVDLKMFITCKTVFIPRKSLFPTRFFSITPMVSKYFQLTNWLIYRGVIDLSKNSKNWKYSYFNNRHFFIFHSYLIMLSAFLKRSRYKNVTPQSSLSFDIDGGHR